MVELNEGLCVCGTVSGKRGEGHWAGLYCGGMVRVCVDSRIV